MNYITTAAAQDHLALAVFLSMLGSYVLGLITMASWQAMAAFNAGVTVGRGQMARECGAELTEALEGPEVFRAGALL